MCVTGHGAQFRICGVAHHSVPQQGDWSRTAPSHMAGVPGLLAGQLLGPQHIHTQQPPPWRLKTEALFSMLAEGGLWSLGAPDFTGLQASHTVPLEAKERHV